MSCVSLLLLFPRLTSHCCVAEDFKYIRDCPVHYTHREYIGTGLLRGKRVPGTNKVTLRMNIADLKLTDAQRKYFAALAGKRFHPGKGELKMTCGLYTIPEGSGIVLRGRLLLFAYVRCLYISASCCARCRQYSLSV